jgi:amino acid permease
MTTDYYRAEQGKKITGTSVLFFAQGLTWFGFDSPGGIFTLQALNLDDAFFRAEIVIGAIVAAYGILVWRGASRKLSFANYIVVLSCMAVLLLCSSKVSEWVYLLDHHKEFAMNALGIFIIDITIPVCILVFGGWWADRTFMCERFRKYIPSSRFVK